MAISFPASPLLNQTYTLGTKTWIWNGYAWDIVTPDISPIYTQANSGVSIAQSAFNQANNSNTFNQAYTNSVVSSNNVTLKAYTDSVVGSNNVTLKAYTDSLVSSNNVTLKAYTDSVVSSNNTSLRANDGITLASAKSYTDSLVSSNNVTLKAYTDSVVASNNTTLKAYTDSVVASNNTTLKAYTDSVVSSNNTTLKAYTDSVVSSNNSSITTAYKSYTDSVVSSNNTTLKAYTDSVMSSNNSSLRANDGITLASAKSYADSNDGITLASAKSYTDAKNTFSTLVNISNDLIVTGNLTIQGTTTTLNSTTLRINDKNLELANVATPTNTTADGGGITVIGATNKTFNWVNSTGAWTSSENLDLASGKSFSINGVTVLTGSTLSSNVTTSSLTAVGTITSGVWSSSFGVVSGANLTNLTAGNLVGAINNIPIGSSTANTGAFTTLSASSTVSGTGFSNYLLSPPAIGTTTPAAGKFTNLEYTGTFTGSTGILNIGSGQVYKDASGNVGIGTSSPSSYGKLAISGNTSVIGGAGFYLHNTDNSAFAHIKNSGGTSVGQMEFYVGNVERMRIDSSGNVGIGTTSPSGKLGIVTIASTAAWQIVANNTGVSNHTGIYADASNNMQFAARDGSGVLRVVIDSNSSTNSYINSGNVGIGTTSPLSRLTVAATNNYLDIYGLIQAYNTGTASTDNASLTVKNYSGTGQFMQWQDIGLRIGSRIKTNTGTGNVVFTYGSDVEGMRIDSSGNVGIGTSSPSYKLQVNGSFAATTKSFVIDHPTKEGMKLRYGSLESPYHGVRLTGEATLIGKICRVDLPDYINGLCKQEGAQVQLTNIKHGKVLWVETVDIDNNYFEVSCERGLFDNKEYSFYWSFTAVRKDIEDIIVEFDNE
jgi:hypothetical protein